MDVVPFNVDVPPADVVDGFVVNHERAVRVLQRRVRRQDRIIWLHHRCRNLRRRIDTAIDDNCTYYARNCTISTG